MDEDQHPSMVFVVAFLLLVLGLGVFLYKNPPQPPTGVCEGPGSTPERCSEWWNDLNDRP